MSFQKQVNLYPAPGVVGARASQNPVATVVAGPGALVAGALGVQVGTFAWVVDGVVHYATEGSTVNSVAKPAGFIANERQGLITPWLGSDTLTVPSGLPITLYERGDFWTKATYNDAAVDNKVYANLFTGEVYAGAPGR